MLLNAIKLLHICLATTGLLAGFMAMMLRKGSGLHGAAGTVFFVSMLGAAGAGVCIALVLSPNSGNAMGSLLTFYLVATGGVAARRRNGRVAIFDLAAFLFAAAIGTAGAIWGVEAALSETGSRDQYPAAFYFIFGSIAVLFAASDVRMLLRGGVSGAKRIARHLWRMSLALLFAALSLYPGQAEFFPEWLRRTNLLFIPHVLLAGAMLLWLYRVAVRKQMPRQNVVKTENARLVPGDLVGSRASPA